jgi:hypothetical protein
MSFKFYAVAPTPEKSTRDCLDPWFMIYVTADRTVKPCCPHSAIGVLSDEVSLSDILNGPGIREVRRRLLEGELDAECANCPTRPLTDPESLRRKVRVRLARAAHETAKP